MGHPGSFLMSFRRPPELETRPEREPPVVPARVAALKANYRQAWIYFFLIISLVVAWAVPVRFMILRRLTFRQIDRGPIDAHEFVAIAFEGISDNPSEISPERFRQHFAGLRSAGYNPVSLAEVHAMYTEGKPLPRRAVLLTFDHSRKSSYFDARTQLRRAGWNAVMFLWTKPILDEDPAALRWPYIRDMIRSGAWEAGAQSNHGFSQIPVDSQGTRQNFMTSPQWLEQDLRFETPDAFLERLVADHEYTTSLIRKEAGQRPRAFAFPYGDFGQYDERAQLTRRINMDLVSRFYDLGFIHGDIGLNTRHSDPRRLNRLMVRPSWSTEEFLRRLELTWPVQEGLVSRELMREPLAWLPEWGGVLLRDETLYLRASPQSNGAKVWLNGTGMLRDFHTKIRLRIPAGQAGVYLRASPDGESHLYLGLGDGGDVYLRQKHPGMDSFTLASGNYLPGEDGIVDLDIFLRGSALFASVQGRPLFSELIHVRGEPVPGMMGVSIWHPENGKASLDISGLDLEVFQSRMVVWEPLLTREPVVAHWLNRNAYRFSHLAPPWLRIGSRGRSELFGWDASQYRAFSELYQIKFTPEVTLENLEVFEPALPAQLFALAQSFGANGLYCNFSEVRGSPTLSSITSWIQQLSQAAEARGMSLSVRLPASLERGPALASLAQSLPALNIVVAGEVQVSPEFGNILEFTRLERAEFPVRSFPLHHQLTGLESTAEEKIVLNARALRQDAMAAFQAGNFDGAVRLLGIWSEQEPLNEEPYTLTGDVQAHRGRFEDAVTAYRGSLNLNPGQTPVVVKLARLLETRMNRRDDAAALLDTYAKLFPDNNDLVLLRAEMLIRERRHDEARALVRHVMERDPDDMRALALSHGLLDTAESRARNLEHILSVGRRPGMSGHFLGAVYDHDLMRWPESWRLVPHIEELAAEQAGQPHAIVHELLPRDTISVDTLGGGRLSDAWEIFGAGQEDEEGPMVLAATPIQTEAALRLRQSSGLRNGFVEVRVENPQGVFWIYARRSENGMIRFGFDQTNRMFLQIWREGQLLANQNRSWPRPPSAVRLRLEVRGDAAFAYIDGQPAFGAPLRIPPTLGYGWWGVGPWSPSFGAAQVTLREIEGGPLPMQMVLFRPRMQPWEDQEYLEILKNRSQQVGVVSPVWFRQEADGRIVPEEMRETPDLRILTRFHQIRLMPVIRSATPRSLDMAALTALAREHLLDGFVIIVNRMPAEEWFALAENEVLTEGVPLLIVRTDEEARIAEVREVSPFTGIFAGARRSRILPMRMPLEDTPPEAASPAEEERGETRTGLLPVAPDVFLVY